MSGRFVQLRELAALACAVLTIRSGAEGAGTVMASFCVLAVVSHELKQLLKAVPRVLTASHALNCLQTFLLEVLFRSVAHTITTSIATSIPRSSEA